MPTPQMSRHVAPPKFVASPYSVRTPMKRPTGYRASPPGPGSTSTSSSMSRPSSAVPKAGGKSLSGKDLTTYRTLQKHDSLKDTRCAPAFVGKLNAAQIKYQDRMRIASLESTDDMKVAGIKIGKSKKDIAQAAAKTKLTAAKAAAYVWAGNCMRGAVPAGQKAGAVAEAAPWSQMPRVVLDAVTAPSYTEPPPSEPSFDAPATVDDVDQAALDEAVIQAEAKKKRNMMILYGVLGLGVAGAAFFLIRRRMA